MNIIQLRWNNGKLQYRQRLLRFIDHLEVIVVGETWGAWKEIEAVKGDETDDITFGPDAD